MRWHSVNVQLFSVVVILDWLICQCFFLVKVLYKKVVNALLGDHYLFYFALARCSEIQYISINCEDMLEKLLLLLFFYIVDDTSRIDFCCDIWLLVIVLKLI